ncbi:MAG TPA: AAA family ATPase [Vicinamibacterales bacterium]|nr:AAA family ATPase [Vicinamibacterales bacterium]
MRVVAVYNMKGGVGKTTAAVNLSFLAAAAGQRALLWDLDPQAASSFALRVRPRVPGFGKKSLAGGHALAAAIRETDYDRLDLLPADFAYRRLDRMLGDIGKPKRVMRALLDTLGRDYDAVFLDCPAGFSLLTEGVFAAADAVLVPTIPTVLSLRMVARVIKRAGRADSPSELAAFFSMVDRRKVLHRRACDWSASYPEIFLAGQISYASIVEQMAIRRMPLPVFAARDPATAAFAAVWAELQKRFLQPAGNRPHPRDRWVLLLRAVESLIVRLESAAGLQPEHASRAPAVGAGSRHEPGPLPAPAVGSDPGASPGPEGEPPGTGDVRFVHSFDTDSRDLLHGGYLLELREHTGSLVVVAARSGGDDEGTAGRAQARIDSLWALQILSGAMSPLDALERRLGPPASRLVEDIRALVGDRRLQRVESRMAGCA